MTAIVEGFALEDSLQPVWTDNEHAFLFSSVQELLEMSTALLEGLQGSRAGTAAVDFTAKCASRFGEFVSNRCMADEALKKGAASPNFARQENKSELTVMCSVLIFSVQVRRHFLGCAT